MTDNEKAATFIGWEPSHPCAQVRWNMDRWNEKEMQVAMGRGWTCECGAYHSPNAPLLHTTWAPDMSKPENYMRALQEAGERHYVEMVVNPKSDGRIWVKFYRGAKDPIEADQPVKALAALYGELNKSQERVKQLEKSVDGLLLQQKRPAYEVPPTQAVADQKGRCSSCGLRAKAPAIEACTIPDCPMKGAVAVQQEEST